MITIEQRANKYWQDKYPYLSGMNMCDAIKTVFAESATEQRKIDIDKACEVYRNELKEFINILGVRLYNIEALGEQIAFEGCVNDFRKAMEEGYDKP